MGTAQVIPETRVLDFFQPANQSGRTHMAEIITACYAPRAEPVVYAPTMDTAQRSDRLQYHVRRHCQIATGVMKRSAPFAGDGRTYPDNRLFPSA